MTWNIAAIADKITNQWIIILTVNFLRATNNTPNRIPADMDPEDAAPHHPPIFILMKKGMKTGVRALANLTIDYMMME